MSALPFLKIFLSSPGDVAEERALAEIVFRRLADEVSDDVRLSVVIWEHEPLFAHTGFQQQIERPSQCDLVVCILWSRLGTRLPSDYAPRPDVPAPTGTEFEVADALESYRRRGKPDLIIYRKIPPPQVELGSADFAERSEQYERLADFCRRAFYDAQGAAVVAHNTFTDGHEFERRLSEHVRRWIDRQIDSPKLGDVVPLWRGQSPFRGLQAFEAEHQAIFFGRSEAISDLVRRLREAEVAAASGVVARILLVQGMSGTGKSSLFKAGLLPLLALRPVEGIAAWSVVALRPSESDAAMPELGPLGVLAARLCESLPGIARLGTSVALLAEKLSSKPAEAVAGIEACLAADADRKGVEPQRVRVLVYIDQLEEAFTLPGASAIAQSLFAVVVAFARSTSLWITATLRSDFAHRLEDYPDLMRCLVHNPPYMLMPPRADELADMIREPARAAGLIWEQRDGISLDQELLRDASGNPEALPLLEYTLAQLYERRAGDQRLLRWSQYEGGLRGALISAAEEVLTVASDDGDTAFREVMRELVAVGHDGVATRRYAPLVGFPEGSPARKLLEHLVERRLCVTTDEGRGTGPVTRLAHEALIRSWPRVQRWLEEETSLLRVRDELASDAAVWEYHKRADDWLGATPEKLAAIRQIAKANLMPPGAAAEYALRSERRAARNMRIREAAVGGICLLTVLACIAWWIALTQRNAARSEAATADRTTGFMVSLFQLADPNENRGNAVTVKEVLDKGAQELGNAAGGDGMRREPRVRAELLTAMGQAYAGLGLFGPAAKLLSEARSDQESTSVPDDARVRTLIASGSVAYLAGSYEPAAQLQRRAVDLARSRLAPSDPLRSEALSSLADVLVQLGKYPEAERLCREALAADRKRGPEEAAVLARTLDSLGKAYFYSGDLGAAEPAMREALKLREQALGMRHSLTAESLGDLGVLLYQSGRYDEALAVYRQGLPIYRAVYGAEHPEVATIINNIGRSALIAGHVEEAEPLLRQALAMTEKFEGLTHDDLVSPLNSLAMIDSYHGKLDLARSEIQRAEAIARLPDRDELLDQVLLTEADIELAAANRGRAAELLSAARTQLQRAHTNDASNAWRYAAWDAVNAQLLAQSGDYVSASRTLAAARHVLAARFGANGFFSLLASRRAQLIATLPQTN
jgi:tetratricopeptide (TPR) repeat protein